MSTTGTATKMAGNIRARRRLSDLFKQGVEIRFWETPEGPVGEVGPFVDKESGRKIPAEDDMVCMFIRPPDPVQRDMCLREANAKRARALVKAKRDEDSEEYLTAMAFIVDMEPNTLIEYVLMGSSGSRRGDAEREILALEEWKDMTSLQDAVRQFAEMDEAERNRDPEFVALMELDLKFGEQVTKRELELQDAERDVLQMTLNAPGGRGEIERKAMERRAELIGNQAYIHEYEKQMRFYSVRDAERIDQLFFESAEELAAQDDAVQELIMEALLPFITEGDEAKNSPRVASGSDSSAPPVAPETSDPSTPEELTE